MPIQFTNGRFQALNSDGTPMVGGKLHTYVSGTTTPQATYTDSTLTVPNTNPIILNGRGEASVWLAELVYTFALANADDVPVWTDDGVDGNSGGSSPVVTGLPLSVTQDPFDADPTGVVDAVFAFQSAINSTTDGTIVVIEVPPGTYKGDFTTLSYGSRTVMFLERGTVAYSVAAPTRQRAFAALNATNVTRPWFIGTWGFADDDGRTTGTTADQPRIYATRNAQHTGGPLGSNPSVISIQHTVGPNVKNYECALTVRMDESATGDATNQPNFVGAQIVGARHAAHTATARTYGINAVANDFSTRGAIDTINQGGLIALECDLRASGPDTEAVRHGILVVPRGLGGSVDGADGIASGIAIRLADTGTATIDAAVRIDDVGAGGGNSYNVGLYALAHFNDRLIDMRSTAGEGVARFGSTLSAGMPAALQLVGNSSTGAERIYAEIAAVITDNTNTAEKGAIQLRPLVAGVTVNTMQVGDGVVIGAPTGSYKGAGTLNVAGDIYKNNTAYANPDYVFEHAYTGNIVRFADNEGAREYQGLLTLEEVERITRDTYKLPGMDGEPLGAFGRVDRLLQLVEEAYLHLFRERRERLALEARLDKAGL